MNQESNLRRLKELHQFLLNIAKMVEKEEPKFGICALVYRQTPWPSTSMMRILRSYFRKWDGYSGDPEYPVSVQPRKGETEFKVALGTYQFWDRTTPYGAKRRDLLVYLINATLEDIHRIES